MKAMMNPKKAYLQPSVKMLALADPFMLTGASVTTTPADPTMPVLGKSHRDWDEPEDVQPDRPYSVWDE